MRSDCTTYWSQYCRAASLAVVAGGGTCIAARQLLQQYYYYCSCSSSYQQLLQLRTYHCSCTVATTYSTHHQQQRAAYGTASTTSPPPAYSCAVLPPTTVQCVGVGGGAVLVHALWQRNYIATTQLLPLVVLLRASTSTTVAARLRAYVRGEENDHALLLHEKCAAAEVVGDLLRKNTAGLEYLTYNYVNKDWIV